MRRDFTMKKRVIVLLLLLLSTAAVALGAYSWNLPSAQSAQQELVLLTRNRELLKKDIQRAREIRSHIPAIQKDCDAFEESLFPESTGYSMVSAELGALAAESGLRLQSRALNSALVKGHDLTLISIDTQLSGDYRSVVRFLNELQRSRNFYAVQSLSARPGGQARGSLQVSVHIKTYFRSA
jgi:hypothetical protein